MKDFTVNQIKNIHLRRIVICFLSPPIIIFILLLILLLSVIMGISGGIDYFFNTFFNQVIPVLNLIKKSWLNK